jgi:outer membrane protein assembly factor BamA
MATSDAVAQEAVSTRRLYPVPVLGYAPETSLMFGVALAGLVTYEAEPEPTRPTAFFAAAVYTLKSQYSLNAAVDRWSRGDRWQTVGEIALSRFPAEFHGIGAAATESSETYTPQAFTLNAAVRRRVVRSGYLGVTYGLRHVRMAEVAAGGRLEPGTVPGSRGGTSALLSVEAVHDTRRAVYGPRAGHLVRVSAGSAGEATGSDFAFRRYTVDGRYYLGLGGRSALAFQAVADQVEGTAPFDRLPQLGGQNILRGYTEPRYKDDAMAAAQVELRVPVRGRIGAAAFAGIGAVVPSLGDLSGRRWHPAGGAGLRFLLDPQAGFQLRVDYAVAPGGGGLYVGAGDAF